ncbi:MAG: DUF4111 domain-containing protein, partial [Gammaproteobacteria bacterium]|nr:DUF4111 domain-containing protein [Gammaproteobacteria bacterium]
GLYLTGSSMLGDFDKRRSDIDIIGICKEPISDFDKECLTEGLKFDNLYCPAAALDFFIVTESAAREIHQDPPYEFAILTGTVWPEEVDSGGAEIESLIDFELCRRKGKKLFGPEPGEIFREVPQERLLGAFKESLTWHKNHAFSEFYDPRGDQAVLNACRVHTYREEDEFVSKSEAAKRYLDSHAQTEVVEQALAIRWGKHKEQLNAQAVMEFITRIAAGLNP